MIPESESGTHVDELMMRGKAQKVSVKKVEFARKLDEELPIDVASMVIGPMKGLSDQCR